MVGVIPPSWGCFGFGFSNPIVLNMASLDARLVISLENQISLKTEKQASF